MSTTAPAVVDYGIPEVAAILGRPAASVREMARDGLIDGAYQITPRGAWRFRRRDFDDWHAGLGPAPVDPNRLEAPTRRSLGRRVYAD